MHTSQLIGINEFSSTVVNNADKLLKFIDSTLIENKLAQFYQQKIKNVVQNLLDQLVQQYISYLQQFEEIILQQLSYAHAPDDLDLLQRSLKTSKDRVYSILNKSWKQIDMTDLQLMVQIYNRDQFVSLVACDHIEKSSNYTIIKQFSDYLQN